MAAAPDRVRYPMNAQSLFFLCTQCRNHLFSIADSIGEFPSGPGVTHGVLCRAAVNVREDDTPRLLNHHPVVNVHCNQCNGHIGERFTDPANAPELHSEQGKYLFYYDKLLYWDGFGLHSCSTGEEIIIYDNGHL